MVKQLKLNNYAKAYPEVSIRTKGEGGNDVSDLEEFVYAYVDWVPGMSFDEAHKEACRRDGQAADGLLKSYQQYVLKGE